MRYEVIAWHPCKADPKADVIYIARDNDRDFILWAKNEAIKRGYKDVEIIDNHNLEKPNFCKGY